MTLFHTLNDFVAHLSTIEADLELAREAAVVKGCQIVQKEAKAVIGTYKDGCGWPRLAPATQDDRVQKGFPPNEPLLRTGSLRESIESTAPVYEGAEVCGYVGSNHPHAIYNELGTAKIPPRSFLGGASRAKEHEVQQAMGRMVEAAFVQGGPNHREMREALHMLLRAYESVKEAGEELMGDGEDER
jgi:HK97 gp10 family phage protein